MTATFKTLLCGCLAAIGLIAAGPQTSHAQAPFGLSVNVGPAGLSYQQGYPGIVAPAVPPLPGPAVCATPAPVITGVPAPYVYPRAYYGYGRAYVAPYRGWHHSRYHHRWH